MNFQETVEFLYAQLPYFTRDGKSAIKKDLNNTLKLCDVLGLPQHQFKSIHIAGTNGKGSVSNMLAAIFQNHGYKTGLYTSPHLKDFRERIRINGVMIPEIEVVQFVEKMMPDIQNIKPSFFELTVALCFDYFASQKVDIAIIETGLGGRLDSTNVIQPVLSVITNIGFDHTDLLGNTLKEIATEKAGIIKPNIPVVIGETQPETQTVFNETAHSKSSTIFFADTNPEFYNTSIECELKGKYQEKNAITVLQSLKVLETLGYQFDTFKTAKAFMDIKSLTGFMGRWEVLGTKPKIIADTAHNFEGLSMVIEQLLNEDFDQLHLVFGMVKDKDRTKILEILPTNGQYYFCAPQLMRALEPQILKEEAEKHGLNGEVYESVEEALKMAKENASPNDLIFVGGSTFVVAEIV